MQLAASEASRPRFHFVWILGPKQDLLFYIGSALFGWLYVGVIWYAIQTLADPLTQPLATLLVGGMQIPLTLELLVVASWALILDAPHVWATLARTLFDPDEWRVRRAELLISFAWFLVGPIAILLPYVIGAIVAPLGYRLPTGLLAIGAIGFFVAFRLWAYYHVVRQHWGFFSLYKRKAGDYQQQRLDTWFFYLSLYMPLVLFMTSAYYLQTPGFPNLGLQQPIGGGWSVASMLYPLAWAVYAGILLLYIAQQLRTWHAGGTLNASKLLYMALIVPLHFVAFSHPMMAVFIVPLVTIGHNIQYLRIVYSYGQNKYRTSDGPRYRWARALFKNVGVYMLVGLVFTFGFYRGPWIEWLQHITGLRLDMVLLNSLGMMAGIRDPAALGLGEQIFAALLLGFAMQHYYLDAKIWRVSKNVDVQKNLKV
jgi:hypothetical protein